jgi:hypothetical protein
MYVFQRVNSAPFVIATLGRRDNPYSFLGARLGEGEIIFKRLIADVLIILLIAPFLPR